MKTLKRNSGQFIPISAMIMFTMVVMMVAMVNVYKVSRAKLKVQNLADAAALNLASKEAQSLNAVADRNEWLNHMVQGLPSPSADPTDPTAQPTCGPEYPNLVPGISCIENSYSTDSSQVHSRHIFHSGGDSKNPGGAYNYASLVNTINQAQLLFAQAYNSFLGDPKASGGLTGSATAGPGNFVGLLKSDIPDLQDPNIHVVTWNSAGEEGNVQGEVKNMVQNPQSLGSSDNNIDPSHMQGLQYKVDHDIAVKYYQKVCVPLLGCQEDGAIASSTLGKLLGTGPVGWMIPDTSNSPQIAVSKGAATSTTANHTGVGVYVVKRIDLPVVGSYAVSAKAKAYIVNGSGLNGTTASGASASSSAPGSPPPLFRPTYWVKLAND